MASGVHRRSLSNRPLLSEAVLGRTLKSIVEGSLSETRPLRIFLNYRREETSGHAGRLYDALVARFDDEHVFMDIDRIEPGLDFTKVITEAVSSCDVVVSLIGSQWLKVSDASGRQRLGKPDDFVRLELEAALERDVRVIPALVQNADMPSSDDLPETLRPLAVRHAIDLSDTRWTFDVEKLLKTLERVREQLAREDTERLAEAAKARREREARDREAAEAAFRKQQEQRERVQAEAKARREADALAKREERAARRRERAHLPSWMGTRVGHRVSLGDGLVVAGAVLVLVGSAMSWAHSGGSGPDIAFVRSFRVPVVVLTLLALVFLAAFVVRRDLGTVVAIAICAAIITTLSVAVFVRLRQEKDKWSGVTDVVIDRGVYVVLIGSLCFLAASLFVAVRRVRDRMAYAAVRG